MRAKRPEWREKRVDGRAVRIVQPETMRGPRILYALAFVASVTVASAHTVYVAPDNHTDYGWNASTTTYDGTMLQEID